MTDRSLRVIAKSSSRIAGHMVLAYVITLGAAIMWSSASLTGVGLG